MHARSFLHSKEAFSQTNLIKVRGDSKNASGSTRASNPVSLRKRPINLLAFIETEVLQSQRNGQDTSSGCATNEIKELMYPSPCPFF